jgi:hypothetical protein
MHLASMMRLVIKEMKDGCRSWFQVILPQAICVSKRPSEKSIVYVFEERNYARVLFAPRGAKFGETLKQDGIQWRCRFASSCKPRHPDSITKQDMIQQIMDAAEGALTFASILNRVQFAALLVKAYVCDSVVTRKHPESIEHINSQEFYRQQKPGCPILRALFAKGGIPRISTTTVAYPVLCKERKGWGTRSDHPNQSIDA